MELQIDQEIIDFINQAEQELSDQFRSLEELADYNQLRVINAMKKAQLAERHFLPATGYGYDDQGREAVENIFKDIFNAEAALVRPHISSGTHAIACALYGNLKPEDEILAISGTPYETVKTFINDENEKGHGTLADYNISYKEIPLKNDQIDIDKVLDSITEKTKLIYIQRSTGYAWRKAFTLDYLETIAKEIKQKKSDCIIFLDNCYGEFLSKQEPLSIGIDLIAGSLIKNPGGGLAPTGGYVAGRKDLVHNAACRLAAPGVAGETGSTLSWAKSVLQGIFFAPSVTVSALKNAILISYIFDKLGFEVCPKPEDERSDIIQSIKLNDKELLTTFCQAIQEAAPIDSFVIPEPWAMPGYQNDVIMAAGSFIQGSSIELSADAPIREPYIVYFQGGLTHSHGKIGIQVVLQRFKDLGFITLKN